MLGSVVPVHLSPPKNLVVLIDSVKIELIGLVAQLVEQRTENPCVGGSIPPRATIKLLIMLTF